jgi:HTH-type transcriptional regulator / antitoxin HigA
MKNGTLTYTVIKSAAQYRKYVSILEELDCSKPSRDKHKDEIDLLLLLIRTWDQEHNTFSDVDPITLIIALMEEKQIKANQIAAESGYSKGLISDVLNYKKGMSKGLIRFFAGYFNLSQELLNRPYDLFETKKTLRNTKASAKPGKVSSRRTRNHKQKSINNL